MWEELIPFQYTIYSEYHISLSFVCGDRLLLIHLNSLYFLYEKKHYFLFLVVQTVFFIYLVDFFLKILSISGNHASRFVFVSLLFCLFSHTRLIGLSIPFPALLSTCVYHLLRFICFIRSGSGQASVQYEMATGQAQQKRRAICGCVAHDGSVVGTAQTVGRR